MVIKSEEIKNSYLNNCHLWALTCLLIIFIEFSNVNTLHSEPFIRVYKQGVIYYYFSNKNDMNSLVNHGNRINNQTRINRPIARKNLSAQELEPWVEWASQNQKIPPALIKAVIKVESNFNPAATSPKGAQGLMQLMPGTAKQMSVSNPYDIQENIQAGARYLGMMLQKFNNNLPMALAAYNAGPQRVQQCQGIPPIKETQGFVRDVCANFLQYTGPAPSR
jgi:hypothetical protein